MTASGACRSSGVLVALLGGCFSEPQGAGEDPAATENTGSSTGTTATAGVTGVSSTTTDAATSGTTNPPTSAGTVGSMGTTNDTLETTFGTAEATTEIETGPVIPPFCVGREFEACESFEPPSIGFAPFDTSPGGITASGMPDPERASSPPGLADLQFTWADSNEAIFGLTSAVVDLPNGQAPLILFEFKVRFDTDFSTSCGDAPVRVFEIQHGEIGGPMSDQIVFRVSPKELDVFQFGADASVTEVVRNFEHTDGGTTDWISVAGTLTPGAAEAEFTVTLGENNAIATGMVRWHTPGAPDVQFNAGVYTDSATGIEYTDCHYQLDDILVVFTQ